MKQMILLTCVLGGRSDGEERDKEKQKCICHAKQTKSTILVLKMSSQSPDFDRNLKESIGHLVLK